MPSSLLQSDGGAFIHMIMIGTFTNLSWPIVNQKQFEFWRSKILLLCYAPLKLHTTGNKVVFYTTMNECVVTLEIEWGNIILCS